MIVKHAIQLEEDQLRKNECANMKGSLFFLKAAFVLLTNTMYKKSLRNVKKNAE